MRYRWGWLLGCATLVACAHSAMATPETTHPATAALHMRQDQDRGGTYGRDDWRDRDRYGNRDDQDQYDQTSWQDRRALANTVQGTHAEIAFARLAMSHSQNPRVKAFAMRMIRDHSPEHDRALSLADRLNVDYSDDMNFDQRREFNRLRGMYGDGFDREYMSWEVQDHTEDIQNASMEANRGMNPEAVRMARYAVRAYRVHLALARRVADLVGSNSYYNGY